jgi:hypothetical protein
VTLKICKQLKYVVPIPKKNVVLSFGRSAANQSLINGVEDRREGDFSSVLYFNSREFFDQKQSGFRAGHS